MEISKDSAVVNIARDVGYRRESKVNVGSVMYSEENSG
jgi:hypothetical protein